MMNASIRYQLEGRTAAAISGNVEREIRRGRLRPGDRLPAVRSLAVDLGVSPGTVAAAYRTLRSRGMAVGDGRRGTRIAPGLASHWMPSSMEPALVEASLPEPSAGGGRDLATGNPDPGLLPDLRAHLAQIAAGPEPLGRLYGQPAQRPELVRLARAGFTADGVPAHSLAVVGGALDGIERVLQAHLRPGDGVAVEDPGYPGVLDLVAALGLVARPMTGDDEGPDPAALDRALAGGAQALIVTPRAQNPTGSAFSESRVRRLRGVLRRHPDALIVEDDHAGLVAGAPCLTLVDRRRARWAVVRSVSKALGPDLRLAVLAADDLTVARVEGRRQLGAGWVSHLLQQLVAALWSDPVVIRGCRSAAEVYGERRTALIAALGRHGLAARGASGLNVWVPVPEEQPVVAGLLAAGWTVKAGESYRRRSGPAIRITAATLLPAEAVEVAAEVARARSPAGTTRLG
jgi:DNA-binding transcriptional MocR family regulator